VEVRAWKEEIVARSETGLSPLRLTISGARWDARGLQAKKTISEDDGHKRNIHNFTTGEPFF
jgi:hypothetical protein